MSLTNSLINAPSITPGQKKMYSVKVADLVAGGAFATVDINLETLPAGTVLLANRIKHSAAVVGPSISAATARLVFNGTSLGAGALDVFAAPGTTDGTHSITGITPVAGDTEAANILLMRVTTTGANLSVVTAGQIDAGVEYTVIPLA